MKTFCVVRYTYISEHLPCLTLDLRIISKLDKFIKCRRIYLNVLQQSRCRAYAFNLMEEGPYWEANSRLFIEDNLLLFWNLKVLYRGHKSVPLEHISVRVFVGVWKGELTEVGGRWPKSHIFWSSRLRTLQCNPLAWDNACWKTKRGIIKPKPLSLGWILKLASILPRLPYGLSQCFPI